VDALAARTDVTAVTPDARMRALHAPDAGAALGPTSMFHVNDTIGAKPMWKAGWSGQGVDVAVVDTGVVPVDGLTAPGKVVNGPDVSFETGVPALRHLDSYGHGTHMAGIIAGRDDSVSSPVKTLGHDRFTGVAPDARIVNVKVADASGGTDVSQVIAGIDWVVQNRTSNGLNIRVLNLSFGTDGLQSYLVDPLAHAVETAWHRGLVVVVSAGNADYGNARLDNPALDPYVIAVGGADSVGTVEPADDRLAAWSSQGDDRRRPDLLAPGQSVVSLRSPGSHLDQMAPGARVDGRFLRGSGTSQAAAVVSGAAALLLQQRPGLSPDQVKALMTASARKLANADTPAAGAGLLDVAAAGRAATPVATQQWPRSLGTGSLDLARGTARVTLDGQPLVGEVTVFGTVWDGAGWAAALAGATTWSGGSWSGNSWSGNSWSGGSWSGNSWSGNSWSGNSWSGGSWSGNSWSGNSWSGNSWSGNSWSGNSWSSAGWPGG
jgi:serine protease AprX